MVPGPSRKGSPQAPRRGISVVYLTIVVSKPGSDPKCIAGVSRISAIRTPGTVWTASESRRFTSAAGPTVRTVTSAEAQGARVDRGLAEDGIGGKGEAAQPRQHVQELGDRRIPQLRIGGVGRL